MPQVLIETIAEFLATYVFTSAGGYAIATVVATVIVGEVASFALGKISQALSGNQSTPGAGPPSQTVTVQGTTESQRIVYGQVLTAGVIAFDGASSSTGTTNDQLWFVITLGGHQCDAITDVYLGPDPIPDANINPTTGAVTAGKYAGLVNIWRHTGAAGDTAQSDFTAPFGFSNFVGPGIAKMYIRMQRDQAAFPSGPPQNFRALVKGKRVYDPRLDSTNGGSGSHRLTDATTWAWSENPALCAADYMTAGSKYFDVTTPLAVLGMRLPTARVNWAFVANSANECDGTVLIPPTPATQKRYTIGAVLSCGDTHDTNLDLILSTMVGQRIFVQGMYRIYAGQYDSPGVSITDTDLTADGYTVAGALTGTDLYNAVVATYFDPNRDWQNVSCAVRTQTTFESSDGGRLLRSIGLGGTTDEYRAQRICELFKKQSRNQIVCTLSLKLSGVKIAPWETFNLTLVEEGWQNKVFRAQAVSMDLAGRRIVVTAKEESSTPYADPLVTDYATPGTAAPGFTIEVPNDPTGLVANGEPYGIAFKWNADPYFARGSYHQLYEFTSSTPFSSATMIADRIYGSSYFLNKTDTVARFYWVVAVNEQKQSSGPDPGVTGVSGAAIQVATAFLATDAASQMVSSFSSSLTTVNVNVSNSPLDTTLATATITATGAPIAIDWSVNYFTGTSAGGTVTNLAFSVYRDGTILATGQGQYSTTPPAFASGEVDLATSTLTDAPSAGSHTYTLHVIANGTGSGSGGPPAPTGVLKYLNAFIKVREIKK